MSSIDSTIFHTYDIRGVYPKQLNELTTYLIGQALVVFLKQQFPTERKISVVIGRDCRLSSPQLFIALSKGIIDQGGQVIDIGLVSTDLVYFARHYLRATAGVMITASHLAKQFNGFKILIKDDRFLSAQFGLSLPLLFSRPVYIYLPPESLKYQCRLIYPAVYCLRHGPDPPDGR